MSELLKINVNEHTEKKNGLTYLSWAWAWAEVLKIDPQSTWEATEFDGMPVKFLPDGSAMVKTSVTIKGHSKSCWLPVMNHRNQAIKNPDAFAINTAIVRCLTKAISMHGLGLYIYAGEDLPEGEEQEKEPEKKSHRHSPVPDVTLPAEREAHVNAVVADIVQCFGDGDELTGIRYWYAADTFADNEERIRAWKLLQPHSKIRSTIRANKPE